MSDVPTAPVISPELLDQIVRAVRAEMIAPKASVRDQVFAAAQSWPDFVAKASVADPDLAAKFTGKALIASKTVWGTLFTMVVSWAVTRWGIGWDDKTCAEVSGAVVMLATAFLRSISDGPITGVVTPATPSQAAQKASAA